MLHTDTYSGILVNREKQACDNADHEKQPEPAFPEHLSPLRHILEEGDQYPGDSGNIGCGLKNLHEGRPAGSPQVLSQSQIEQQVDKRAKIKRYLFFGTLHMGTLETLYFPDTIIAGDGQSPLFLLFDRVHYLLPVETDSAQPPGQSDTFMDNGFCQAHTPAPLGADRNRFLRLVTDIRQRKDDYAAQLSSLAVASLSAPRRDDEKSKSAILSSLMGGVPDQGSKEKAARQAELWQARLVLAMAEILDREEAEITRALNRLDKNKMELFDRLLGRDEDFEDDSPFTDLAQLQERINLPRPGMIKNRLKAWLSLYRSSPLACRLWTTTRPEAGELLLEMQQERTGTAAISLWQMELPATTGTKLQDKLDRIRTFRKAAGPLAARIAGKFEALVRQRPTLDQNAESLLPEGSVWEKEWAGLLEIHFPTELYGRIPLQFHLLPGLSLAEPAEAQQAGSVNENGILAIIGQR